MGLDGAEFVSLDQGGDGCPVCGSGVVPREEGVFAVQSDGPDGALHGVVVHFDPAIGEEQAKTCPVFCDVFQRLTQGRLCGYAGAVVGEPSLEGGDLRRGLVLADGQAGVGGQVPDLGFDLVELGDALQPVLGDRGGAVAGDFKEFAAGMGAEIRKLDGRASPVGLVQTVVTGIAVDLQNAGEALQNVIGILAATPRRIG